MTVFGENTSSLFVPPTFTTHTATCPFPITPAVLAAAAGAALVDKFDPPTAGATPVPATRLDVTESGAAGTEVAAAPFPAFPTGPGMIVTACGAAAAGVVCAKVVRGNVASSDDAKSENRYSMLALTKID